MFTFHCPECSLLSFTEGIPLCLRCGTIESTTEEGDNFHPPEPEAPSEFGALSGSKNYYLPNDMQKAEVVSLQYRNRNKANDREVMENSAGHKKSRSEVWGVNDYVLPTCRKQGEINYNFETEKRNTNAMEFEKGCLDGISNEFPNKEPNPHKQSIQEFGYLKKTIHQNNASNFGNFQSIQDDQPQESSDLGASKRETTISFDDILAVPGPSGYRENAKRANLREGKLQSRSSLEVQTVGVADKNAFICGGCKGEIEGHLSEHEGRYIYQCCSCDYSSDIKNNSQMHTRIHDTYHCNICGELTLEKEAHVSRRICELCNKTFQCKSLLEQHTLAHEDYYFVHCRVCGKDIIVHIDPDDIKLYTCCECPFTSIQRNNLRTHLYTHADLNLYKCDSCQQRFNRQSSLFRHMRTPSKLLLCWEIFFSRVSRDEHKNINGQPSEHFLCCRLKITPPLTE